MSKKLTVNCEFGGVVNGVPVAITGRGHVGEGRLDAELVADVVPLSFDPALIALGGLDAVLFLASCDFDHPVHVHLGFTLLDENYRAMGGFEIAASVELVPGGLELRGQLVEARTRMEPVERVVSVGEMSSAVVPLGADGVVLTTASGFESDHGAGYLVVAVSRVVGLSREAVGGLDVRGVIVERAGGRERDYRVMVGVEYVPQKPEICAAIITGGG